MTKELVIAGYTYPLGWIKNVNNDTKITIYRKGDIYKSNYEEIKIEPNKGRCVHTFFSHIYNRYDNLSDVTFFVQDNPFDHWENLIYVINNNLWESEYTLNIENNYYGFNISTIHNPFTLIQTTQFTDGKILKCQGNGCPNHCNLKVDEYWDILFDEPRPNFYEFLPAGHFAIKRQQIKNRTKNFYFKIKQLLENDDEMPFVIERLECYIFSSKYKTKF